MIKLLIQMVVKDHDLFFSQMTRNYLVLNFCYLMHELIKREIQKNKIKIYEEELAAAEAQLAELQAGR